MRRYARFLLPLLVVLLAAMFVAPSAQAYLHQANCQDGLRSGGAGDYDHDDDVHAAGVYFGASQWGGWATFWRMSDTYVRQDFYLLINGYWTTKRGYCQGNDSGFQDWYAAGTV